MQFSVASMLTLLPIVGLVAGSPVFPRQQVTEDDSCDSSTATNLSGATGQAGVKNTCSYPVYVQSVAGQTIGPVVTLKPGFLYLETFHNGPGGSGVAVKITNDTSNWSTPMLFEYCPNKAMDLVFYDISVSVGGYGEGTGGIGNDYELVPSASDDGPCPTVNYNNSYVHLGETDYATKSCSLSTNITLHLC